MTRPRSRSWVGLLVLPVALSACVSSPQVPKPVTSTPTYSLPRRLALPTFTNAPRVPTDIIFTSPAPSATVTFIPNLPPSPTETASPTTTAPDPDSWMAWPVIPVIGKHAREIYIFGQTLGNAPQSFSILGDCQGDPGIFLGPYVTDPAAFEALPPKLQETARYFEGSLFRFSPTVKSGTTAAALFWPEWHGRKYGCMGAETPLDCELRKHNPSFALIMVGTHYESGRNEYYMRMVVDTLLARGIVPILSTKADNYEGDNHINREAALLASEYDLPLWNFWPVVGDLPNRGLYAQNYLGDVFLTEEALALRRYSALQVLDALWRAVTENE